MHYYPFNIADYQSHTKHLTPIEDICYRRLLDWQYLHEKPLPNDVDYLTRVLMLNGCSTDVQRMLNEFFSLTDNGWINVRALAEIQAYNDKLDKASKAGKASAARRRDAIQQTFNGSSTDVQPNKKQEPINNNQEPSVLAPQKNKAKRFDGDERISFEFLKEAEKIKPEYNSEQVVFVYAGFRDYWISKAGKDGTKLDWLATWRNWLRNQKSNVVVNADFKKNKGYLMTDNQFDGWLNSGEKNAR